VDKKVWLSIEEVSNLGPTGLKVLRAKGLIDKALNSELGYCNICSSHRIIINNKNVNKRFYFCLNCGVYKIFNKNNLLQYFTDLKFIVSFISRNLNLPLQGRNVDERRLIYFGRKNKVSYYFLHGVNHFKFSFALRKIQAAHSCYIFCLESYQNAYDLKIPKNVKLYNLSECLVFSETKLQFSVPKPLNRIMIASLGGISCSEKKFGEARRFVQALFKQKRALNFSQKKKQICAEIYRELIKKPELIANLSEDNLFDWILKQTRNLK
jgi:hypothetical protein